MKTNLRNLLFQKEEAKSYEEAKYLIERVEKTASFVENAIEKRLNKYDIKTNDVRLFFEGMPNLFSSVLLIPNGQTFGVNKTKLYNKFAIQINSTYLTVDIKKYTPTVNCWSSYEFGGTCSCINHPAVTWELSI